MCDPFQKQGHLSCERRQAKNEGTGRLSGTPWGKSQTDSKSDLPVPSHALGKCRSSRGHGRPPVLTWSPAVEPSRPSTALGTTPRFVGRERREVQGGQAQCTQRAQNPADLPTARVREKRRDRFQAPAGALVTLELSSADMEAFSGQTVLRQLLPHSSRRRVKEDYVTKKKRTPGGPSDLHGES